MNRFYEYYCYKKEENNSSEQQGHHQRFSFRHQIIQKMATNSFVQQVFFKWIRPFVKSKAVHWQSSSYSRNVIVLFFLTLVTWTAAVTHRANYGSQRVLEGPDLFTTNTEEKIPTDNDNVRIPGTFWNDRLHILGVRLTTSYEAKDESVSFDVFAHAVGEGSNSIFDLASQKQHSVELNYKEASQQPLYCEVPVATTTDSTDTANKRIKMKYLPSVSIDSNTEHVHLIWRCDLSNYVTKTDMLQHHHIRVNVYTSEDQIESIMTVDVPVDTASIGYAGPMIKSSKEPSFVQQVVNNGPLDVVLCVGGITTDQLKYIPEFVQHHLNVGVGQIVLGMETLDESLLAKLQSLLSFYMDKGLVVIAASSAVTDSSHIRKLRFYNQCLFHAKGMAEFVAMWDLDELWVPKLQDSYSKSRHHLRHDGNEDEHGELWSDSAYRKSPGIVEAIHSMTGENGCKDWCFQAFPSRTVERTEFAQLGSAHPQWQGFYGFPVRDQDPNPLFQKSVARTKLAWQFSFHVAGSCRRENSGDKTYVSMFEECPLWSGRDDSLGAIHHYQRLFLPEAGVVDPNSYTALDEYTHHMRPAVVEQLSHLQQQRAGLLG